MQTKTGLTIHPIDDGIVVSEDKVMHSAAGYYIGQGYIEPMFLEEGLTMEDVTEDMLVLPYDRNSNYYADKAKAELSLSNGMYFRT